MRAPEPLSAGAEDLDSQADDVCAVRSVRSGVCPTNGVGPLVFVVARDGIAQHYTSIVALPLTGIRLNPAA